LIESVVVCLVAVVLDHVLGEPKRGHPVVGFGNFASRMEGRLNRPPGSVVRGGVALVLVTSPVLAVAAAITYFLNGPLLWALEAVCLWLALSLRGLAEHGRAVLLPLTMGDTATARDAVSRIVSRDATQLDDAGIATAATESMLENGADAVFASLFWFLVAGLPGLLLHRMVNTLDAMWGYRNERFNEFGRCAARLDDLLNWIPARLTATTYALLGRTRLAMQCWREQATQWDSPNAGPVMASGAGALGVELGGPAPYREGLRKRPLLGAGVTASADTVESAIRLVYRGVVLWLLFLGIGAMVFWLYQALTP